MISLPLVDSGSSDAACLGALEGGAAATQWLRSNPSGSVLNRILVLQRRCGETQVTDATFPGPENLAPLYTLLVFPKHVYIDGYNNSASTFLRLSYPRFDQHMNAGVFCGETSIQQSLRSYGRNIVTCVMEND